VYGRKLHPLKATLATKWGQPRVNLGSTWGQPGVNLGSTRGQPGGNPGSTWARPGIDLGSTWGELALARPHPGGVADALGAGADVREARRHKVRRVVHLVDHRDVRPGRKCSKYQMLEFNSRIDGLECVEGRFEHFLPSPTGMATRSCPPAMSAHSTPAVGAHV